MLALLLATVSTVPASAQSPADTPEQVARLYVEAIRASDWNAAARLMHADALHEMRDALSALVEHPEAGEFRQQLLGVGTVAEARALSDTAVYVSIMRLTSQQPGLSEAMRSAEARILGRVDEGRDTTHVTYRVAMTVQNVPVSMVDVMSLARSPHGWRGLLKGEMAAFAAGIRAALEKQQ
jgi:hypothetical protein